MKLTISCSLFLLIAACKPAAENGVQAIPEVKASDLWTSYEKILSKHVKERFYTSENGSFFHNGFDYHSFADDKDSMGLLSSQVQKLKYSKAPNEKSDKLAFWINAYNFFTLVELSKNHPVKSMKDIGWKNKTHDIGGELYSLDQIEHQIIRPLGEPMIHFAINCAAVSCPSLSKEIFKGDEITQQMKLLVENALKNPLHLKLEEGELLSTKLFEWFSEDFEKAPYNDIDGFVREYAPPKLKMDISDWIEYDWALNSPEKMHEVMTGLNVQVRP